MRKNTKYVIGASALLVLIISCGVVVGRVLTENSNETPNRERKSTEQILRELREFMTNPSVVGEETIKAYIVPSGDAHQSEYVSARDRRRAYITGFTGSSGTAIISETKAALWTDSRYFLQAEMQMDSNFWTLMKQGELTTPSQANWLISILPENSRVGVDPFLMSSTEYESLSSSLIASGHELVSINQNLIDLIWNDRPEVVYDPIYPLPHQFSGKNIADKIIELRAEFLKHDAEAFIVSSLDDIAWMLNLRGSDIAYNPVFFSYAVVTISNIYLFVNEGRITDEITNHFQDEGAIVIIKEYNALLEDIAQLVGIAKKKIILPNIVSHAIYLAVPANKRISIKSPISLKKAIKNSVEVKGMINAHIRDGLAVVKYLHWLDTNVDDNIVTELSGAEKLKEFRSKLDNYKGLSFTAISAFGANAAIVHYSANEETDTQITREKPYLIDSGGQYWDGTTDVTRTVHLGTPTNLQKEFFTRVLKGYIALGTSTFPNKTYGAALDAFARKALWDVGLDYGHGTSHGIGSFLGVHEYPPSVPGTNDGSNPGLMENMFMSNEPGYYQDNDFGIRIEDIVQIVKDVNSPYDFNGRGALTTHSITLVPIQTKMIDTSLLSTAEVTILNNYHKRVFEIIGELLKNETDVLNWLKQETKAIVSTKLP